MRIATIFAILAVICFATTLAQFQNKLAQNRSFQRFNTYTNVTAADFKPVFEKHLSTTFVVDVREPDEYAAGHIPDAFNLPLSVIEDRYTELPTNKNLYVHCKGGFRSLKAIAFLETKAVRTLINVSDGFDGWIAAGGEVVVDRKFTRLDYYVIALKAMEIIPRDETHVEQAPVESLNNVMNFKKVEQNVPVASLNNIMNYKKVEPLTRLDYYVIALKAMEIIPRDETLVEKKAPVESLTNIMNYQKVGPEAPVKSLNNVMNYRKVAPALNLDKKISALHNIMNYKKVAPLTRLDRYVIALKAMNIIP